MEFMGIGPMEMLLILFISLIVLGPEKMVETARTLGKAWRSLQRNIKDVTDSLELDEVQRPAPLPPRRAPSEPVPPPDGSQPQRQDGPGQEPPKPPDTPK